VKLDNILTLNYNDNRLLPNNLKLIVEVLYIYEGLNINSLKV
jgi:hypothetical protein